MWPPSWPNSASRTYGVLRDGLSICELIATWKGQGRLGTRAEQHEANVVARLKDDPDRPDQGLLTDVELRVGAERLALALSLTRTLTIRAPELSVDVDHALGVLDSSLILPDWSEEKRQALLRRALFDPSDLWARQIPPSIRPGVPLCSAIRRIAQERHVDESSLSSAVCGTIRRAGCHPVNEADRCLVGFVGPSRSA